MNNASLLFSQLADLTAMRDIELMEFSLLKTLNSFLMPNSLRIIKIDINGRTCMDISFNNTHCVVNTEHLVIPEEIMTAINELQTSGSQDHTVVIGDELLSIFQIHKTRAINVFLTIVCNKPISLNNAYLINGMLQIYRNFCDVIRSGQTDQLTGLFNRKTFDDSINKIFGLIPVEDNQYPDNRREKKSLGYWLVMIDIDHFKAVNDKFGHLFGDEVLVLLAQMMMSMFRDEDLIFRFGGEEFVLIIRSPDQTACRIALERFRIAFENRQIPQVGKITISLGACRMSRDTFSATLLDYADKALYYSKHNGRNQLTFFEDLLEAGLAEEEHIVPGEITLF